MGFPIRLEWLSGGAPAHAHVEWESRIGKSNTYLGLILDTVVGPILESPNYDQKYNFCEGPLHLGPDRTD